MDAKLKDLWLKALRSGEYAQGTTFLRSNNAYCCLGVLCDVASKNALLPAGVHLRDDEDGDMNCNGWPVSIPAEAFGLSYIVAHEAMHRNDCDRETFAQIADWLETAVPTDEPKEPK